MLGMITINQRTENGIVMYMQSKYYITRTISSKNGEVFRVHQISKNKWKQSRYLFEHQSIQPCINWIEKKVGV